jgi:hypothetical protein
VSAIAPALEGCHLMRELIDLQLLSFEFFVAAGELRCPCTELGIAFTDLSAYSGDGDRRFRFIVTGLARSEVLGVDDNSVGHDGCLVGTGFGLLCGSAQRLAL